MSTLKEGGMVARCKRASHNGNEKVVRLLLDYGANVNAQGGEYGSALNLTSRSGSSNFRGCFSGMEEGCQW
jgi:ankyrin repeat protein